MNKPTLIILAAGMGSRFGGLKQITAVDEFGHAIIDFSLYDAYRAGFRDVAFIIKKEIEEDFKKAVGYRMEKYFNVSYVFQQLDSIPEGLSIPEGRVKPWGTGHAVACCLGTVKGPFAVINADDFYGQTAFSALYDFLVSEKADNEHAMVAYKLRNTVTDNGYVARGVCSVKDGFLSDIEEKTHIEKAGSDGLCTENDNEYIIPGDTLVSMNCWGFGYSMLEQLNARFKAWFVRNVPDNPMKAEYFLPFIADEVIKEGLGTVKVLDCNEKWYGVTYKEDLGGVVSAVADMRKQGKYPDRLLD